MRTNFYPPEGGIIGTPKNIAMCKSLASLEKSMENGLILEGRAFKCSESHDLYVKLPGGITGIIPYAECVTERTKENSREIAVISRVGKSVCFKVIGFDGDTPILSRKDAQIECFENCISLYEPGDILDAVVTHLEPFGAFCDIGCGIISLLSIDTMSVSRITHPKDRFCTGQKIKVAVKQSCDSDGRIQITHKELLGTWEENASLFHQGQAVTGIVRSIEKYGVFIELTPNLAGLAEYSENLEIGDTVSVFIKSIIPEKMKIKLVVIDKSDKIKPDLEYDYKYTEGRICRFTYSPECCERKNETIFQNTKSNWIP